MVHALSFTLRTPEGNVEYLQRKLSDTLPIVQSDLSALDSYAENISTHPHVMIETIVNHVSTVSVYYHLVEPLEGMMRSTFALQGKALSAEEYSSFFIQLFSTYLSLDYNQHTLKATSEKLLERVVQKQLIDHRRALDATVEYLRTFSQSLNLPENASEAEHLFMQQVELVTPSVAFLIAYASESPENPPLSTTQTQIQAYAQLYTTIASLLRTSGCTRVSIDIPAIGCSVPASQQYDQANIQLHVQRSGLDKFYQALEDNRPDEDLSCLDTRSSEELLALVNLSTYVNLTWLSCASRNEISSSSTDPEYASAEAALRTAGIFGKRPLHVLLRDHRIVHIASTVAVHVPGLLKHLVHTIRAFATEELRTRLSLCVALIPRIQTSVAHAFLQEQGHLPSEEITSPLANIAHRLSVILSGLSCSETSVQPTAEDDMLEALEDLSTEDPVVGLSTSVAQWMRLLEVGFSASSTVPTSKIIQDVMMSLQSCESLLESEFDHAGGLAAAARPHPIYKHEAAHLVITTVRMLDLFFKGVSSDQVLLSLLLHQAEGLLLLDKVIYQINISESTEERAPFILLMRQMQESLNDFSRKMSLHSST